MTITNVEPTSPSTRPRLPEELAASTPFLMKRLGFAVKEQSLATYEEAGLSPYHHGILAVLDEGSRETQGAIADALGYDSGQLVGLLDALEDRRLVHLLRPDHEGRARLETGLVERALADAGVLDGAEDDRRGGDAVLPVVV